LSGGAGGGGVGGKGGGGGRGGEINQALYAHMNNKRKMKKNMYFNTNNIWSHMYVFKST
jgi:hypothetical protein